jgi:O-antigen/teichoic acid export membrane protein
MGSEFYGLWAILYAIIQIAGVGTAGMSSIVNKFASESQANSEKKFGEIIAGGVTIVFFLAILTALILLVLQNLIVANLKISSLAAQAQFKSAILIITLSLIPQFVSRVYQGFLFSQIKYNLAKQIDLYYQIGLWTGIVLISIWQRNLIFIAMWCFVISFLSLLAYMIAVKRTCTYQFSFNPSVIRRMLRFSGYLFIESSAITFFQQMDTVLVGMVLGPSIAGVYSVGTSVSVRLSLVTGQITEVMIPYASLKDSLKDHQKLYSTFRRLSHYVSLVVSLTGAAAIIWMNELLSVWISADYALKYSNFYRILIIAYCFLSLARPAHQTLTGMGKVKFTSIVYSIATFFMLSSLYFLSQKIGLLGAVLADCIMIFLLIYNIYVYHMLDSKKPWTEFFSDLGIGLFSPIILYGIILIIPGLGIKLALTVLYLALCILILRKDMWLKTEARKLIH